MPQWIRITVTCLVLIGGCTPEEFATSDESERSTSYKHTKSELGPAPYRMYLTSYGGSNDTHYMGTPACGGKGVDGVWYYSTGAYAFGCNSRLLIEANGKAVVVNVVDNGPSSWVEAKTKKKCGGTGYIIDASPSVSKYLFGSSSAGWSDCFAIKVTPVDKSTPDGPYHGGGSGGFGGDDHGGSGGDDHGGSGGDDHGGSGGDDHGGSGGDDHGWSAPKPKPCGNGKIDPGETCDIGIPAGYPDACPKSCDDGDSCTDDGLSGSGCWRKCKHTPVCPANPCGNGKIDAGERCDTAIPAGAPGACPKSCFDFNPCTEDRLVGSGCDARCENVGACPEKPCGNGKLDFGELCDTAIPGGAGACPKGCDDGDPCTNDVTVGEGCKQRCEHHSTCPKHICGDGKISGGELCDTAMPPKSPGRCPKSCDDGNSCTKDELKGSGCKAYCVHTPVCPAPSCGNGKLEPTELCDTKIPAGKPGACPTSCNDGKKCTRDELHGKGCKKSCANPPIPGCKDGKPAVPGRPYGAPCDKNHECISGKCLPASTGFLGGMCTRHCMTHCQQPEGERPAHCIKIDFGLGPMADKNKSGGHCYSVCDYTLSPTGCRKAYRCVPRQAVGGGQQMVCVPESQAGAAPPSPPPPAPPSSPPPDPGSPGASPYHQSYGACSVGASARFGPVAVVLVLLGLVLLRRRATRRS